MGLVETAVERILPPLAQLIHKPLRLVDGRANAGPLAFAIRGSSPLLSIVNATGEPLSAEERALLGEIFDIVSAAQEGEARYLELEQRMFALQRENVDLSVKNRALSEVSSRDTLTGLYNRSYVIDKLESEINRAVRHGSPMALLMLDIDHFKTINDTYGHPVGDQVLQWVGRTLRESCRVYDIPGRYGGEEFCVVLPQTQLGNTTVVAERVRTRMAEAELRLADASVQVTASFGIAGVDSVPEDGIISAAALIDRADRALYTAKNRGRNRVELWENGTPGGGH